MVVVKGSFYEEMFRHYLQQYTRTSSTAVIESCVESLLR